MGSHVLRHLFASLPGRRGARRRRLCSDGRSTTAEPDDLLSIQYFNQGEAERQRSGLWFLSPLGFVPIFGQLDMLLLFAAPVVCVPRSPFLQSSFRPALAFLEKLRFLASAADEQRTPGWTLKIRSREVIHTRI